MRKSLNIFFLYFALYVNIFAQEGISIGTNIPAQDAIFHLESNTQGLLLPTYNLDLDIYSKEVRDLFTGEPQDESMLYYNGFNSSPYTYINDEWQSLRSFPSGSISIWTRGVSNIPDGWVICDGNNGSPDLRGRFIVGFDEENYSSVGSTGGEKKHTLSESELPSHNHEIVDPGHQHLASATHNHSLTYPKYTAAFSGEFSMSGNGGAQNSISVNSSEVSLSSAITTIVTSNSINQISPVGKGDPHENRPNYYVVIFIMKE